MTLFIVHFQKVPFGVTENAVAVVTEGQKRNRFQAVTSEERQVNTVWDSSPSNVVDLGNQKPFGRQPMISIHTLLFSPADQSNNGPEPSPSEST